MIKTEPGRLPVGKSTIRKVKHVVDLETRGVMGGIDEIYAKFTKGTPRTWSVSPGAMKKRAQRRQKEAKKRAAKKKAAKEPSV